VVSDSGNILSVEDGIPGIESSLVLCGITDQTLLLGEGNERRSNTVTLLVGNCRSLHVSILLKEKSNIYGCIVGCIAAVVVGGNILISTPLPS